jgi:hypothetical protein
MVEACAFANRMAVSPAVVVIVQVVAEVPLLTPFEHVAAGDMVGVTLLGKLTPEIESLNDGVESL